MARAKRKVSTFSILIICLLAMGFFVTTSLYFDVRHKNTLLLKEIERLQSSQVLLMVPDEQAEIVAKWMAEHPQATAALLQHAKPQQEVKVTVGPGVEIAESRAHTMSQKEAQTAALMGPDDIVVPLDTEEVKNDVEGGKAEKELVVVPLVISENEDGVKLISLPHGGIRVTTR